MRRKQRVTLTGFALLKSNSINKELKFLNKEIQKSRVKRYFIDAAKEILLNEGALNVSVRKVGDATGYSYATIYNYFKNLDHLLWCIGIEFVKDIVKIYDNDFVKDSYTPEDIKHLLNRYIDYYFENPNVFNFFFFYQVEEPPEDLKEELVRPSLEKILVSILENLAQQKIVEYEKVLVISGLIMNSVHGMLLMYFSKKRKVTKHEIHRKSEEMIQFLLG